MEGYKREGLSSSRKNHQKLISFGMHSTPKRLSKRGPSLSPSYENDIDKENRNQRNRNLQDSNDIPDSDDSYNQWHLKESQKL